MNTREIQKLHHVSRTTAWRMRRDGRLNEAPKHVRNLIGRRFGALVVIEAAANPGPLGEVRWHANCDCGAHIVTDGTRLRSGRIKNCGCGAVGKREPARTQAKGFAEISDARWRQFVSANQKKGVAVGITARQAFELFEAQQRICALSGIPICLSPSTATLDRADRSKGFIAGNVCWVHTSIKQMQLGLSRGEFIWLCGRVAAKHSLQL